MRAHLVLRQVAPFALRHSRDAQARLPWSRLRSPPLIPVARVAWPPGSV